MNQTQRTQVRSCLDCNARRTDAKHDQCDTCNLTGTVAIPDHPRLDEPGMRQRIFGCARTREVWVNGRLLDPAESLSIQSHSPTGFCWGYGGNGPAQLALAVALTLTDSATAEREHQGLKTRFLAKGRDEDLEMETEAISRWLAPRRGPGAGREQRKR